MKSFPTTPLQFFTVVLCLGFALATYSARRSSFPGEEAQKTSRALSENEKYHPLSDQKKAFLAEDQETSRWLLGLASGALALTLGARVSGSRAADQDTRAMMIAYACFLVSMYGAFLSHQVKLGILGGSLENIYTGMLRTPMLIQAWFLALGMVALGVAVFTKPGIALVLLLAASFWHGSAASAQSIDEKACVAKWNTERLRSAGADPRVVVAYLDALVEKGRKAQPAGSDAANVPTISSCLVVDVALDRVRSLVTGKLQHAATGHEMESYMKENMRELKTAGASVGEAAAVLISLLTPWQTPYGYLRIAVAKGQPPVTFRLSRGHAQVYDNQTTPTLIQIDTSQQKVLVQQEDSLATLWSASVQVANGNTKDILLPVQP